jgi:hypothetical protein
MSLYREPGYHKINYEVMNVAAIDPLSQVYDRIGLSACGVGFFYSPFSIFRRKDSIMNFPLSTKLAGVSYGDCPDNIKQFGCPDTGFYILIRELDNQHDPNAIAVSLGGVWHMGYIPSRLAKYLAPLMDAGREFDAEFICVNEFPPHERVGLTVRIVETTTN